MALARVNYTKEDAQEIALVVDKIIASLESNLPLDPRTKLWLEHTPDDLRRRLSKAGLVDVMRVPTLGEVFDAYWELEIPKLKTSTATVRAWSKRKLFEFVDPETKLFDFWQKYQKIPPRGIEPFVIHRIKSSRDHDFDHLSSNSLFSLVIFSILLANIYVRRPYETNLTRYAFIFAILSVRKRSNLLAALVRTTATYCVDFVM